jgi:hypothetical protein
MISFGVSGSRKCRNLLAPSRARRQAMAQNFDNQWRELRKHATIERDPQMLAKLVADRKNANRSDMFYKPDGI